MSGDTDRLARLAEWARMRGRGEPVARDVLALVEIAKAARAWNYSKYDFELMDALDDALSALDGDA